jgi:hypothetical protein
VCFLFFIASYYSAAYSLCIFFCEILLFDVQKQAFQVLALGMINTNGMIHGMGQLTHNAYPTVGIGCSCEAHGLEIVAADGL